MFIFLNTIIKCCCDITIRTITAFNINTWSFLQHLPDHLLSRLVLIDVHVRVVPSFYVSLFNVSYPSRVVFLSFPYVLLCVILDLLSKDYVPRWNRSDLDPSKSFIKNWNSRQHNILLDVFASNDYSCVSFPIWLPWILLKFTV